ncbi:MAG TPA: DUF4097 family beta strand repeat-containing protein [Vicinamibacterales bacterium]|nr:DUF4097 family beta strand repeat-containing protein [Vicinamibacterales bacterium]
MLTLNRFRTLRVAALALPVMFVASAGCDIAMADHKEKETSEWRKTYELQPGGRVEIGNVNGKIEVVPGQGNTVEIVALKTGHGVSKEAATAALSRVEILEEVSAAVVRVDTKIQRSSGGLFGGGGLQVDYTVRVPMGAEVKATTVNGGVEIVGIGGRINAGATNGGIKVRDVTGPVEASTTNGGVDVDLAKLSEGGVKLECTNGGIKLRLPPDSKASISARITNGGIETTGLTLDSSSSEPSKRRLDARLNGGGARVDIEGTNGGIRISSR